MTQLTPRRSTELIHHPYRPPSEFDATMPGVFKASSVFFPNVAALRRRRWDDKSAYTYGLHGTPTTFMLEERLATLEGARHVLLAPSGLSAITTVDMALLRQGDVVVLPDNVYGPSLNFAQHELAHWGIGHRLYDPMDASSLASVLSDEVKLVWLEAPGSVTLEFPDLRALVRLVRQRAPQAVVALDNTWGAGLAFAPFELGEGLGVDLTVHALTKYPSGGGDVLMGSIACRDAGLYQTLAWAHSRLGLGVGANDVEAVLRSLPTLELRYHAQDRAARRIAQWCCEQPEFVRVLHPAMPGSPGHEHWQSLCSAAAGLLTVELDPRFTPAQGDAFVDALRVFRIGWSWGGPVSLAVPYRAEGMRRLPTPYQGTLVRLCIGLEAVDDLIADLAQAKDTALGAR
ncbi:MAG: cystathionine beta-lyase [Caldimonas sp.]|uniref:trans-sulfuration enzyme family protein n=1 Tax=Caldimonas manganoxidans TaxID=196015 RepID=UPI00039CD3F0|nr:PLP-dependent transferase [Caldimonas manganoxidans]GIX25269.1 MAG: cystathionine beta-lyase [Caldimonas sp.]